MYSLRLRLLLKCFAFFKMNPRFIIILNKFYNYFQIYHVKEPYTLSETHFLNDVRNDYQPFPKLEKAFTDVDTNVGFNIELKWTMKLQVIIYYNYVIYHDCIL